MTEDESEGTRQHSALLYILQGSAWSTHLYKAESSVNHIHSIQHYNCPKYNSQLAALAPWGDMAWINNAQQSSVSQQCANEGYFSESWHYNNQCTTGETSSSLSSHNTAMTSHFSHYMVSVFLKWNCRQSYRYSTHTQFVIWEVEYGSLLNWCKKLASLENSFQVKLRLDMNLHIVHIHNKLIFSCFCYPPLTWSFLFVSAFSPFCWLYWLQT